MCFHLYVFFNFFHQYFVVFNVWIFQLPWMLIPRYFILFDAIVNATVIAISFLRLFVKIQKCNRFLCVDFVYCYFVKFMYSWPSSNTGLNCTGLLARIVFSWGFRCHLWIEIVLLLLQFESLSFFFLSSRCVGLPVHTAVVEVLACPFLACSLMEGESFPSFTTAYDTSCGFFNKNHFPCWGSSLLVQVGRVFFIMRGC